MIGLIALVVFPVFDTSGYLFVALEALSAVI